MTAIITPAEVIPTVVPDWRRAHAYIMGWVDTALPGYRTVAIGGTTYTFSNLAGLLANTPTGIDVVHEFSMPAHEAWIEERVTLTNHSNNTLNLPDARCGFVFGPPAPEDAAAAVDAFGGIDVLVNSAFRGDAFQSVEHSDLDNWRKITSEVKVEMTE